METRSAFNAWLGPRSLVILIGELSLWVALLMAAWTTAVSFAGAAKRRDDLIQSGARAIHVTLGLAALATAGLFAALIARDFSVQFVAEHASVNLPKLYILAAFWSGGAGLALLWLLFHAACASAIQLTAGSMPQRHAASLNGVLGFVTVVLLMHICFGANPFQRLDWSPPDGRGLVAALQHPMMALQPVVLRMGLAASVLPCALCIAAALSGAASDRWLRSMRAATLVTWLLITLGGALGFWWAYDEPARRATWLHDPIEHGSIFSWLTCTALLHTLIVQERHGLVRRWNSFLAVLTFVFAIGAMLIARGTAIESVNALAHSRVGLWYAIVATAACMATFASLRNAPRGIKVENDVPQAVPRDIAIENEAPHAVSREGALVASNVVLIGITVVATATQIGASPQVGPMVSAFSLLGFGLLAVSTLFAWRRASTSTLPRLAWYPLVAGAAVVVSLAIFDVRQPFALLCYFVAGLTVGAATQEVIAGVRARIRVFNEGIGIALLHLLVQQRRQFGASIVHVGLVLMFCSVVTQRYARELTVSLKTGEVSTSIDALGRTWTFTGLGMSRFEVLNRSSVSASLDVARDAKRVGVVTSELRQYLSTDGEPIDDPVVRPGILRGFSQDVYVEFIGASQSETADIHIRFNPLVSWLWYGSALMVIGILAAMWPSRQPPFAPTKAIPT